MKITVLVCYKHPDYVRTRTLLAALRSIPDLQIDVIANTQRGVQRYPEVFLKLLKYRFTQKTDVYLVTFRGYELLLMMRLSLVRTPIVFDEFINFTEWMDEHGKIHPGGLGYRLFRRWYGRLAGSCKVILADTEAHAAYSAELNRLTLSQYLSIPVGTDETMFYPQALETTGAKRPFTVFYYGTMLPLHGLDYVLEAAEQLQSFEDIRFYFVGGGASIKAACDEAIAGGARVTYESWLPFEQIPQTAREAGLCLGGPFGNTLQSQYVITGKTYQFLALGAPVLVGKNLVSNPFKDKENALVVPQGDAGALADAIRWAYEHPVELAKVARAGRQLYEQQLSQQVVNDKVRGLIERLQDVQK